MSAFRSGFGSDAIRRWQNGSQMGASGAGLSESATVAFAGTGQRRRLGMTSLSPPVEDLEAPNPN